MVKQEQSLKPFCVKYEMCVLCVIIVENSNMHAVLPG